MWRVPPHKKKGNFLAAWNNICRQHFYKFPENKTTREMPNTLLTCWKKNKSILELRKVKHNIYIYTWELISKLKRSWARADTPTVAADTPWCPSDSESPVVEGLQHCPHSHLKAFPILEFPQALSTHTVKTKLMMKQRKTFLLTRTEKVGLD